MSIDNVENIKCESMGHFSGPDDDELKIALKDIDKKIGFEMDYDSVKKCADGKNRCIFCIRTYGCYYPKCSSEYENRSEQPGFFYQGLNLSSCENHILSPHCSSG